MFGYWAIDSLNCNAMSTGQQYLHDTAADVVLLQELRVRGDALLAAQREAARSGWSLAAEPARATEAGSTSAGVGVAVRSHLGLCQPEGLAGHDACQGRVIVSHLGAVCSGGIFLVSAYFWCNEGTSQRNLAILQAVAQMVRQLHGPWVMAGDFNFSPSVLEGTGWLALVRGAIVATGQATCKGAAEDDYFVVDARLRGAVVGVALVNDTGSRPHSAVRLWLKGRPRADTVRVLVAPARAEAVLPQGCLPQNAGDGWGALAELDCLKEASREDLNRDYVAWVTKVEEQLSDVAGFSQQQRAAFCRRAVGPVFAVRSALGSPGSCSRRVSAITVAWRTVAGWLTDIAQALGAGAHAQVVARARRAQWLFLAYSWAHLGDGAHAEAFRAWARMAASRGWRDRVWVNWLRATAELIAKRAVAYDCKRSDAAWASWLRDGPCKSLGRHHRLTRVASGWVPSPVASERADGGPDDDLEGDAVVSQQELDTAEAFTTAVPMSLQAVVDAEARSWGQEWGADRPRADIRWPVDWSSRSPLPELGVEAVKMAAATFPAATGLGWDKLHPRAVCRCAEGAIAALVRLFVLAELLGEWPDAIG
eukprot:15395888-Alexandrium_andersonii.AAC.1